MLLKKASNPILRHIFFDIYLLFDIFLQNVWSVSNNVLLWIHGPILTEPGTYVRHFGLYGHIPICEENLLDSQNWLKKQSKLTEKTVKIDCKSKQKICWHIILMTFRGVFFRLRSH